MIEAFASLGLFMFGMIYLEDSLKKAAGSSFKKWVKISTDTDAKAVFAGASATALLQSSSVVTLMALSLTGAGLMSLQSAIGVIFGSNIGTTATGWIIALIGFKFDIKLIAFVMVGFGGIGSVLFGEGKTRYVFGGLTGFGLIFLGLEGLKESFSSLAETIDITSLSEYNALVFLFAGLVLTALIQSSSASVAIAQSALFTGILGFDHAAAFVIGANVGTTATAIIGAAGGSSDKKRTAVAHVLFNLFTGIIAFLLLTPITWSVTHIGLDQSVEALALFHTVFNLLGVVIWFPLIPKLTRWLQTKFLVVKPVMTRYIHNVSHTIPALEHEALRQEVIHLGHKVCSFAVAAIHIPPEEGLKHHASIAKILETYKQPLLPSPLERYHDLQHLQGEILDYASALSVRIQLPEIRKEFDQTLYMATQLIGASKYIRDILHDIEMLSESETREMEAFFHELRYQILALCMHYTDWLNGDSEASAKLEALFTKLDTSYKNSIAILNDMIVNYKISKQMTAIFMNITHITRNFSKALYKSMSPQNDRSLNSDP
ncbi:MAG: Na/Pi cotransporter family protein [Sulfuricurvum sp.]|jgi:phosphate:Na+ symporter|uniref:Na/Pi cotransporter family protein n=1 Tax=Sulfuricurvum sp. IAE1 TaxID=2546102 RepID=UPI0021074BDD|nr:Na/Pi symporter [Sulfuricurvum sp. IAE1]MDD3769681.1 Na/Pi symporter [Sulfuricurvum sp.]MDD3769723.1 Na/Pi symporter [Sulfuricurvum sp.]MDX9966717.1 Na/Pi symporter [Sulfuricurvum sp.]